MSRLPGLVPGVAQLLQIAAVALGLARDAYLAAVVDQLMREGDPAVFWNHTHQFLLHLLRSVALSEAQPVRNAKDVRVDDHAFGFLEAHAEYNVGRLARRTGNGDQLGQRLRNLAAKVRIDRLRRAFDGLCLVAKEPGCADELFKFRQPRLGHGSRSREAFEQCWSDHVHAYVRALRGEDCGHQKLPWRGVMECAFDVRISLVQALENGGDAFGGEVTA